MVKVEWKNNFDVNMPVIYPYSTPKCASWCRSGFRDYFVEKLTKMLKRNNLEIIYLLGKFDYKYTISGSNVTKLIIEYTFIAQIKHPKIPERIVTITIHSDTINLAKLNRDERVKYLCNLVNNIINKIIMLGRASVGVDLMKYPVTVITRDIDVKNTKMSIFSVENDYFSIKMSGYGLKQSNNPPIIMAKVRLDKTPSKTIFKVIESLKLFTLNVEWDTLEPVIIASKRSLTEPDKIFRRVLELLEKYTKEIYRGNIKLKENTLKISITLKQKEWEVTTNINH